jgi:ATP-dependent protease Clp ATPase subunit
MYEIPSDDTIEKVIVTKECVEDGVEPQIIRSGMRKLRPSVGKKMIDDEETA